eukprot:674156-Pyramimonas_sp.AAC.1
MPCSCGVCRGPVRYAVLRCVPCVLLCFSMFRRVTVQSAMLLCIQPRSCAFCVFCRAPASHAAVRYLVQNLTKRRDAQNNASGFFLRFRRMQCKPQLCMSRWHHEAPVGLKHHHWI